MTILKTTFEMEKKQEFDQFYFYEHNEHFNKQINNTDHFHFILVTMVSDKFF